MSTRHWVTSQVNGALDGEVFEGAEVVAAVVEGGLAAEDLVADEQAEGLELGAVPADVDDLAPVPLRFRYEYTG